MDNLTEEEIKQFQSFAQQEAVRQEVNKAIQKLTSICWDRCIGKPGDSMSSKETTCLKNCADRYLDTSTHIMQKMTSGEQ